jgi:phosphatidylserine/phosphatidylglycerophosphate/cardiolipin synthase-like enzyme
VPTFTDVTPPPLRALGLASLSTLAILAGVPACGGGDAAAPAAEGADYTAASTKTVLEIHALDLWAQPLPQKDAELAVTVGGKKVATTGWPVVQVPLTAAGTVAITLGAREHHALTLEVQYDGSGDAAGAKLVLGDGAKGHGHSLSHEVRKDAGKSVTVHSLYLGLRHKWFSAEGRPARRGNAIELLMDGEQAWARVHDDLAAARKSILLSTWWWESDFEIVRKNADHAYLSPEARWKNTMLGTLEASPAEKRVLVNRFWGQGSVLGWLNTDKKLRAHAEATDDGFEFMAQGNDTSGQFHFEATPFLFGERVRAAFPEATAQAFADEAAIQSTLPEYDVDLTEWPVGVDVDHASYHQKFVVVDDDIAFIGGMNVKAVDWDTSDHLVYDYRRMGFGASEADRLAVLAKEKKPATGPRKDYYLRIQGPAAQDAADVFHERWEYQIAEGVDFAEKSTSFEVARDIPEQPGGPQVQVTATLPQPFWEHAIAETWVNAVSNADQYIYIEDQYFRAPLLSDAIAARMAANPDVRLVVITKPINEWTDPGCPQTYLANQLFASAFPDRYLLLQLRSFDAHETWGIDETTAEFADLDTHSKMLIVDDKFMSVGSANKNNRGMVYEGELNAAVLDPAFVKEARRRILANMLPAGTTPSDDPAGWWGQLVAAAKANDAVYAAWDAEGFDISLDGAPLPAAYVPDRFVYSLHFGAVGDCLMESVGPDMTGKPKSPWPAPQY